MFIFYCIYIIIYLYIYYWSWSYSCPNFPPLPPSTWYSHSLQQSPHPLVNVLGQACKFFGFSISYTVLNHVYFVPTNLCFLIPALFPPFFPILLPTDNPTNYLLIYDSVSVILVSLVCFSDSIVDTCEFIAILSFDILLFLK